MARVEALAYSTLAVTVGLAVSQPRAGRLRITPGVAALVGVIVLVAAGVIAPADLAAAARIQWRPLLSLTCIMILSGVASEVGIFERLAARIEAHARTRSAGRAFALMYAVAALTPALLNNDAAILLLTPLAVTLATRLYPRQPRVVEAFAFAVFLAPGVAPLIVSNPMNLVVAETAGIGFNAYATVMAPIALAGTLATYLVLRRRFASALDGAEVACDGDVVMPPRHAAERPIAALVVAVFAAYPVVASLGGQLWMVTLAGAIAALAVAGRHRVAPARRLLSHVSPDILVFLWGVFLVVVGLRHVGIVARVAALYHGVAPGSAAQLALVGVGSAVGSAVVDNHPMALVNMMALAGDGNRPLFAALVGGDVGPRLLPIGSLAGLLWMALLRRAGVRISVGKFVGVGTLALIPTLLLSLVMLALH
jgi:arsenical pump membrane protein